MTKEQMQAAMEKANAEAATAKKRIAELETQNGKLSAELDAEKKNSEAKAGTNAILEHDLNAARNENAELKKQIEHLQAQAAATGAVDSGDAKKQLDFYRGLAESGKNKVAFLLAELSNSCTDHCPHGGKNEACRNCGIYKRITAAGFAFEPCCLKGEPK